MKVQECKLDMFVRLGGYEIVNRIKRGKRKGRWRNISKASRRTGISRPTIYKILGEYPEKPSKVKPKYVDKVEESEGYKRFAQKYEAKLDRNSFQQNEYS